MCFLFSQTDVAPKESVDTLHYLSRWDNKSIFLTETGAPNTEIAKTELIQVAKILNVAQVQGNAC
jgi:hypothetical protein